MFEGFSYIMKIRAPLAFVTLNCPNSQRPTLEGKRRLFCSLGVGPEPPPPCAAMGAPPHHSRHALFLSIFDPPPCLITKKMWEPRGGVVYFSSLSWLRGKTFWRGWLARHFVPFSIILEKHSVLAAVDAAECHSTLKQALRKIAFQIVALLRCSQAFGIFFLF